MLQAENLIMSLTGKINCHAIVSGFLFRFNFLLKWGYLSGIDGLEGSNKHFTPSRVLFLIYRCLHKAKKITLIHK